MKKLIAKARAMGFKKAFIAFFVALAAFGAIVAIVSLARGETAGLSRLWEQLTLARFRERMFTDIFGAFRFIGHLFALTFIGLVFAWAYTKIGKKDKGGEQA
ncbi:MAG: hypothetical protein FWC69_03330 [Defluviitaleaceae bacterium]|nr:hypothetical protein [Defluviitaleaceae bacterium]